MDKNRVGIHQLLPGFTQGDAISNEALEIQKVITEWGYDSKIFTVARHTSPKVKHLCSDNTEYKDSENDIIIYHHSIGTALSDFFKKIKAKKVMIYHNITPDKYLRNINAEKSLALLNGRDQLKELVGVPDLSLADSAYNAKELSDLGYKNPRVLPIMLNYNSFNEKPNKTVLNKYRDKMVNLMFVGRISPNKRIEDVIKVFYYYKKTINVNSRLFIVGSFVGTERYYDYLRALTIELDIPNIVFTGHVTSSELLSYYRLADAFICMSEHEGFCIPLVEAMYFKMPVIGYNAAAVPDTLGGSGVLVGEKNFPEIAELLNIVLTKEDTKKRIIEGQNKRLKDFSNEKIAGLFKEYIGELIS